MLCISLLEVFVYRWTRQTLQTSPNDANDLIVHTQASSFWRNYMESKSKPGAVTSKVKVKIWQFNEAHKISIYIYKAACADVCMLHLSFVRPSP